MAQRVKISPIGKFVIALGVLIVAEVLYLTVFSSNEEPVTFRDQLDKQVSAQGDLPPQRKDMLKVQLALADFKAKKGSFPNSLNDLVPEYFDVVPVDSTTGQPLKYTITDGKYFLGDKQPETKSVTTVDTKLDPSILESLENNAEQTAFVYDPNGKRDPFEPFDFSGVSGVVDPNNPLTSYDYGQLRLSSVLAGLEDPIAIVENSAGKGFTVRKGTKIGKNSGEVVEILKDKLIIIEERTDFTGETKRETIELLLRSKGDPKK